MKLQDRIDKALERVRSMVDKKRKAARQRQCQGATWEELIELFCDSILPESEDVLEDIVNQIEEYQQRPPQPRVNGEPTKDIHGFVEWLHGIQDGWASLPDEIPHAVLLSWRNDYARRRAKALSHFPGFGDGFCGTPVPMNRCADCHMVQPNCSPGGFGAWIIPCPVCGSENFEQMNFFAWGTFHPI
jgi:hypothetical protein